MKTYVALLRGINVGGRNSLPMKALVSHLEKMGATQVKTYIQSGNVVFKSATKDVAQLGQQLGAEIRKHHGFEPQILILELAAIDAALADNPFPEAEEAPASLHFGFLASAPTKPNLEKLNQLRKASERFELKEKVFYLHAPEGIGRSKLAAASEKLLGVPMTDRNLNTVRKLKELGAMLDGK